MLFNFRLKNIDDIAPWSTPSKGNALSLHWFGLTDGWFWIDIGGQQLFRYSPKILEHWAQETPPHAPLPPFDNYYLARYWEDLLRVASSALDPLPNDFAAKVADVDAWSTWRERVDMWRQTSQNDEALDLVDTALGWWSSRTWDNGHLRVPPTIWLWSVGDTVYMRWDCRNTTTDETPIWDAQHGEASMLKSEFIAAVQSFDNRLIGEMAKRVEEVKAHWARPGIAIDISSLEREQDYRATIGENALGRIHRDYEWDDVRAAMARIEAEFCR